MKSPIIKRSIILNGRKTSISVEDLFWLGLKEMARETGTTLARMVCAIDASRAEGANLSSAIRVVVLAHVKDRAQSLARVGDVPALAAAPPPPRERRPRPTSPPWLPLGRRACDEDLRHPAQHPALP